MATLVFLPAVGFGLDNAAAEALPVFQAHQAHPQQLTRHLQGWAVEELAWQALNCHGANFTVFIRDWASNLADGINTSWLLGIRSDLSKKSGGEYPQFLYSCKSMLISAECIWLDFFKNSIFFLLGKV
jgi:hypothetical protein